MCALAHPHRCMMYTFLAMLLLPKCNYTCLQLRIEIIPINIRSKSFGIILLKFLSLHPQHFSSSHHQLFCQHINNIDFQQCCNKTEFTSLVGIDFIYNCTFLLTLIRISKFTLDIGIAKKCSRLALNIN